MNLVSSKRAIFFALIFALAASLAFAQSDLGSISGFVKDPSGSTVPDAKVTVRNQSGLERQATTNESGYYTITNIPPRLYTITVEAAGFKKFESPNNKLDPSGALTVNATLTVGAATETVEVTAAAANLQTESATVQNNVTRQQIDALELNGRNPIFMANLVPGTRGGNLSGLSFSFSQGPSNINGARTPESLITYDGAPAVRTRSNGTASARPMWIPPRKSRSSPRTTLPSTAARPAARSASSRESGTQQFHGAAYDYSATTPSTPTPGPATTRPDSPAAPAPHQLQPVRLQRRRSVLHSRQVQHRQEKVFWYWGQEWVRYRFTDTSYADRALAADAAGQFQRTAESRPTSSTARWSRSRIRPPELRSRATSSRRASSARTASAF